MSAWQVGLSTGCFYRTSIFEVLEAIRYSGFSFVEICSHPAHLDYNDREKVRKAATCLQRYGLQPFSFHAPFGSGIDIASPVEEQRRKSIAELRAAVKAAAILGAGHFVIHPGPEKEAGPDPEKNWHMLRLCAESLRIIAEDCWRHGMKIVLENMLPHLFPADAADLCGLMRQLDDLRPGFCLDTGHAHISGDLHRLIRVFVTDMLMIHAADNKGREDEHLPPGKGTINWPEIWTLLRKGDFKGVVMLELAGDSGDKKEEILAEALKARHFLEKLAGS